MRAANGADGAVEAEFAGDAQPLDALGGDLPACREHRERDGEVEGRAGLHLVGGTQVHRSPSRRDFEARIDERGADALARFFHRIRRQPDDGPGPPSPRDIDFDDDRVGVNADDRGGMDGGEHGARYIDTRR